MGRSWPLPRSSPSFTPATRGPPTSWPFCRSWPRPATGRRRPPSTGSGRSRSFPPVMLSDPAPKSVTDAMLESSLAANTSGANPAWGAADPSTIYLFVLPEGTIESDAEGACCTDYDGYHFQTDVGVGLERGDGALRAVVRLPGLRRAQRHRPAGAHRRHEPRAGRDGDRSFPRQRSGVHAGG